MGRTAILVCEDLEGPALQIAQILELFSVPWKQFVPRTLADSASEDTNGPYCVLAPMPLVGRVLMDQSVGDALPPLLQKAESIFLFGGDNSAATQSMLQMMSRCATARIAQIQRKEITCSISDRRADLCGPMSGLDARVPVRGTQLAMVAISNEGCVDPLISTEEGCIFAVVDFKQSRCYLAPSPAIIDISLPLEKAYFDVAEHFFSAVPLVMYLRHAFKDTIAAPADNGACLVVDDPVLRPKYGFFDFHRVSEMAAEHHFTCTVAFIPWNWKRTRPSVAQLFQSSAGRLSLSIHGCDHSGREFGTSDAQALNARAKLAVSRMEKHRIRSGLAHEPLMIFPQGVFSAVSLAVLKHNGFVAAINTEVSPVDREARTEIGEVWQMAIRRYSDFAIYTRRYPFHGLHNFAFDLLLGKPCIIVAHSGDFSDEGGELLDFIDRLNSLKSKLTWRPLGDVIRHAFQQKVRADGVHQITMFGNEISVENSGGSSWHIAVEKLEHCPEGVDRVEIAGTEVRFAADRGRLRFELDLGGRDSALIRVSYKDIYGSPRHKRPLGTQVKQVARRYLSEFRDESQARAPWVYGLAQKARSWGNRLPSTH